MCQVFDMSDMSSQFFLLKSVGFFFYSFALPILSSTMFHLACAKPVCLNYSSSEKRIYFLLLYVVDPWAMWELGC